MHRRTALRTPLGLLRNDDGDGGGAGPAPAPKPTPPADGDKGYPEGTPLEQMTAPQQTAYWKAAARKHEDRSKAFGNLTADDLTALREKAARADALDHELSSESEKAVKAAKDEATREATPRVVRAEFRAVAAELGMDKDRLNALIEDVDLTRYVDSKGEPDLERIEAKLKPFVTQEPPRSGPTAGGLGHRTLVPAVPGQAGREEAERRFGKQ